MKRISILLFSLTLSPALIMGAYAAEHTATPAAAAAKPADSASLSSGEIKKIDKDASKITLKHGPLVNLNMPAMTMVFKLQSPQLLNAVKVGDKVKFRAESINGALTVTQIEVATP
ncbi:MAG: copper-binding protein [Thiobacillus sp.]